MRIIDLATHYSALPDDPILPVNDSTTYQMMYHYLNNHRLSREPDIVFYIQISEYHFSVLS
ncbi:MAG: hypothetical protein IPG09_18575 [Ignavibacteria bacterium]|nr:hypothetical protein [Ignavibacteria bacterium]